MSHVEFDSSKALEAGRAANHCAARFSSRHRVAAVALLVLCGFGSEVRAQDCAAHCDFLIAREMIAGEVCATQTFDPSQTVEYSKLRLGARDFGTFPIGTLYPVNVFDKALTGAFTTDDPGFTAVPNPCSAEPTLSPLPAARGLYLDFLTAPPTGGGARRTILYWDGVDDNLDGLDENDVDWSPVPLDEIIRATEVGVTATADGGTSAIAGIHIQDTSATGNIHDHIEFALRRSGGGLATTGLYMVHLDFTMPGFAEGTPTFLIFQTPGIAAGTKSIARNQVENQMVQPLCSDGIDNDRDGLTDFSGGDPGCSGPTDDSEKAAGIACDDGIDNDLDGKIDFRAADFGAANLYATRDVKCGSPSDPTGEASPAAVPGLTPLGALALCLTLAATGYRSSARRA